MNKDTLEALINAGKTIREIAAELKTSFSSVRYWIKKYNLVPKAKMIKTREKEDALVLLCVSCFVSQPKTNFRRHPYKDKIYTNNTCNKCRHIENLQRMRTYKELLVDYKGGQCERCGYSHCIAALDFHHKDPATKSFSISQGHKKFHVLKEEVDKCILLCANCHREVHEQENTPYLKHWTT